MSAAASATAVSSAKPQATSLSARVRYKFLCAVKRQAGNWDTRYYAIMEYALAGDASQPLPTALSFESPADFAWQTLEWLGVDADQKEHEAKQDSSTSGSPVRSEWTEEDAKAVVGVLRPFAATWKGRVITLHVTEALLELCRVLPIVALLVLQDNAFTGSCRFDAEDLGQLVRATNGRVLAYDPTNQDHLRRMAVLKAFVDRMPNEQLNCEWNHPLITAAQSCDAIHQETWYTLLSSWFPQCGTRMRLEGASVVRPDLMPRRSSPLAIAMGTAHPKLKRPTGENESGRLEIKEALHLLIPMPVHVALGGHYLKRHAMLFGGLAQVTARHKADCATTCATIRESGAVDAVDPIAVLIAGYLFDAAYLPGNQTRGAAATAAAVEPSACTAITARALERIASVATAAADRPAGVVSAVSRATRVDTL